MVLAAAALRERNAMIEQLRLILQAESEARQQLDAARQEAQRLVQEAEESGRRLIREAEMARDALARSVEDALVAAAQDKARQITEDTRTRAAALRTQAMPRMERALETIVKRVLRGDDTDGR
jgi:vacuolar-type H+-ATPase subunit H